MDRKIDRGTTIVGALLAISVLIASPQVAAQDALPADITVIEPSDMSGPQPALAKLIGSEDRDPDLEEVLKIIAANPADLGISSEEMANLLVAALPVLDAAGRTADIGTALKQRLDLYLVDGEKDEVWAERAQDYAAWLAANDMRPAAETLQKEAVAVLETQLGAGNIALIPFLEALQSLVPVGSAEERAIADQVAALKLRDQQLAGEVVVMGPAPMLTIPNGQRPMEKIRVYFATNRLKQAGKWLINDPYYSDTPGPTLYGFANMLVPQRINDLASRTSIWALEVKSASLKKTNIVSVQAISNAQSFFTSVRGSSRGEILIYVHGFNMTFSDALKSTANLAVDLDLRGPAVAYSWPSAGSWWKYWRDGRVIADRQTQLPQHLASLIGRLSQDNPGARIMLVVHSMGNRIAVPALAKLGAAEATPKLSNVILASADIGKSDFMANAANVAKVTKRLTIYASGDDMALKVSTFINGELRTGSPKALNSTAPGDKIDTTGAADAISGMSADYLGHNDYLRPALADIRGLFWQGLSPATRCPLKAAGFYFTIAQVGCSASDFTDALVLRRRLKTKQASLDHVRQRIDLALASEERARWSRIATIVQSLP